MDQRAQNQGFQRAGIEEQKQNNSPSHFYSKSIVPQAKSILSGNAIDKSRPKILIKQIRITIQPPELHQSSMNASKGSLPYIPREQFSYPNVDLYQHYINTDYQLIYYRYSKGSTRQIPHRDIKKIFSKEYFSSYFLKLDFIKQYGNCLIKNLEATSLSSQIQIPVQHLQFNSRFECGNLFAVFKNKHSHEDVYDLILQNDINTKGYNQWFYFSIRNKSAKRIKLRIVNLIKPDSLFKKGMKPAVFSYRRMIRDKTGWERRGDKLQYGTTNYLREREDKFLYSYLSFQLDLEDNDITYIATTLPYSYTRLQSYLNLLEQRHENVEGVSWKKEKLVSTISSNTCYLITLTSKRIKTQPKIKKKYVCLIGRQHPCETVSSFVMEGVINYLLSGTTQSLQLLKNFVFKIVPMMNPDGVIYGNSRCDISGADINRQWCFPNGDVYPTVNACKTMLMRLSNTGHDLQYFFDIHGHSKQLNSFIYGPRLPSQQYIPRVLSFIMSKLNNNFRYSDCEFGLNIYKRKTARANALKMMKYSHHSFTLQTSIFGHGSYYKSEHFTVENLKHIGQSLMMAFYYQKFKPEDNNHGIEMDQIIEELCQVMKYKRKSTPEQELIQQQEKQEEKSGSDSEPSVGQLKIEEKQKIFLPHALANQLRQAIKQEEIERQRQLRRQKLSRSMNKQSSKTLEVPKKILEKLKSTNPSPFNLSESRSKPKLIKLNSDRPQRGESVPLSNIPMLIDIPDRYFKQKHKHGQSLVQAVKRLSRKSFFENHIDQMESTVLISKSHQRYSQNLKESLKLQKPLISAQSAEMKTYESVDRIFEKRISFMGQKSKKIERAMIQKYKWAANIYQGNYESGH